MEAVYKHNLQLDNVQELHIPWPREFLHVGLDGAGELSLWTRHNRDDVPAPVTIIILGTGQPIPIIADRHLGTVTVGPHTTYHIFTTPNQPKP